MKTPNQLAKEMLLRYESGNTREDVRETVVQEGIDMGILIHGKEAVHDAFKSIGGTGDIDVSIVEDKEEKAEALQRTGLLLQKAGAPLGEATLFLAAHGKDRSYCLLVYPESTGLGDDLFRLTGGTKEQRKARAESVREMFCKQGAEIY